MNVLRGAIVAACLLAWPGAAAAQRSLVIQQFAADVEVGTGGAISVTETIQPRFTGTWNGIYRTIPVGYRTPQGFTYQLRLDVESVSDETGAPLRYESSRERHYRKLKIWIPGAVDTVKTVVVRYRVLNGLKFFEEHDELYWNVTGDEWDVPIERAHRGRPPAIGGHGHPVVRVHRRLRVAGVGGAHHDGRDNAHRRDDARAELPRGRDRGDRVEPGSGGAPDRGRQDPGLPAGERRRCSSPSACSA